MKKGNMKAYKILRMRRIHLCSVVTTQNHRCVAYSVLVWS